MNCSQLHCLEVENSHNIILSWLIAKEGNRFGQLGNGRSGKAASKEDKVDVKCVVEIPGGVMKVNPVKSIIVADPNSSRELPRPSLFGLIDRYLTAWLLTYDTTRHARWRQAGAKMLVTPRLSASMVSL